MRLADLQGRRVAVWGTGREGRAAVIAVAAHGPAGLVAVDDSGNFLACPGRASSPRRRRSPSVTRRSRSGGRRRRGALAGHAADAPLDGRAAPSRRPGHQGTALWMADHADRTVGVTGSKGKSTTSSLVSHLLAAVGRPNVFGGNIGVPVLDLPGDADQYVLELSSYQCSDLTVSPRVAVVTALFPEHLDAHGGERGVLPRQAQPVAHGPKAIIYNAADPRLAPRLRDRPEAIAGQRPRRFHLDGDDVVAPDGTRLFERAALNLPGRHNGGNLCVALAVLTALGVDCVARSGRPARGRRELPGRCRTGSPRSGPVRAHLRRRHAGHQPVRDDTRDRRVRGQAVDRDRRRHRPRRLTTACCATTWGSTRSPCSAIPDSGPRIVDALKGLRAVHAEVVDDLAAAVRLARELTPPGGVVLMSPGAPSYGRFRNFEHRCEVFAEAIRDPPPPEPTSRPTGGPGGARP